MHTEATQPYTQTASDTLLIHRVWSEAGSATPSYVTCDLPPFQQVASEVITTKPSTVSETLSIPKTGAEAMGAKQMSHDLSSKQHGVSEGMPSTSHSGAGVH